MCHLSTEYCESRLNSFCVILLTNKQIHNLHKGGKIHLSRVSHMFTDFSINCWSELNNERLSLCLAGSDAQSHQRRALASLQSTIAEHVEQLKDMEKRTLMVSEC